MTTCLFCAGEPRRLGAGADELVRCSGCGHMSRPGAAVPRAEAATVEAEFREAGVTAGWLLSVLPGEVSRRPDLAVLDVGCWDGALLKGLPASWRRAGIEMNAGAARRAAGAGLDVRASSIEDFKGEEGAFDLILLMDVLEHIGSPQETFNRLGLLLKPGGRIAILTGDAASLGARLADGSWYYANYVEHVQFYTAESLSLAAAASGLSVESVRRLRRPGPGLWRDVKVALSRTAKGTGGAARVYRPWGLNTATASRLWHGRDHMFALVRRTPSP